MAVFLDKIDWFVGNKSEFMNVYRDNLYSSSRYEIKDQSKEGSFIYQYKLINIYYSLKLQKVIFEKEILNKNLVINENINKINYNKVSLLKIYIYISTMCKAWQGVPEAPTVTLNKKKNSILIIKLRENKN